MRVLMVTNEWPTAANPAAVPFLVRQADSLRRAGVEVEVLHSQGRMRPQNYWEGWRRVRARLNGEDFDLVHAQFGQSGLLGLPRRRPLVVTFRGSDLQGIVDARGRYTPAGVLLRCLSYLVARRADAVVAVSAHLRRYLPPREVVVIPSGLDLEAFRPMPRAEARRRLGLPEAGNLVLFGGNPAMTVKRFDLARAVVDRLDPALGARLVTVAGRPHADIPLFMNACDALLLTSRHEGSPNVVKEALACDLPVVSTAVGDVPERLRDLEGCAVCADERPAALAAALEGVLRRGGRVAGRARVLDLDEGRLTERLIAVYLGVLPQPAGRPVAV